MYFLNVFLYIKEHVKDLHENIKKYIKEQVTEIHEKIKKCKDFKEERDGCFAWFAFLMSQDGRVALPRHAMGLSAVCDCGIS